MTDCEKCAADETRKLEDERRIREYAERRKAAIKERFGLDEYDSHEIYSLWDDYLDRF